MALDKEAWKWQITQLSAIAKPLATRKLTKKIYKLAKNAYEFKGVRRGIKDVQKYIRKNKKGIVILAGDCEPIDSIAHLPIYCEDHELLYCYTPSMEDLGLSHGSTKPCMAIMIEEKSEYCDLYNDCLSRIKELESPILL